MRFKDLLGLGILTYFGIKGMYRLHQYYNYKQDFNQTLADIANDGIDGVNDLVSVFSDNKQEIELCDNMSKITKSGIELIAEAERR